MKRPVTLFTILFSLCMLVSCTRDFIVKNIKNDTVTIISPADGLTTPNNSILFWWNELDGAEKYNIQIVKPNFNSVTQLMADTNVTGTKFNFTFTPGTYQWRIRAINAGGTTAYTIRNIVIDTTSNLNYLLVNATAPASYSVTNSKTVNFTWDPLTVATSYNLKVFSGSATGATVLDINTTSSNYTNSFSTAGVYFWKVNASNAFSNSAYSTPMSFKIDQTAPPAPLLSRPLTTSIVQDTAYFRWNYSSGVSGSDIEFDSLYVSAFADSAFATPYTAIANRSSTALNNNYKISSLIAFPTASLTVTSYYWWKVKSVDSVGNVSPASQIFKVKLTN
jgi:hypothetical protein